jgi:glucosamine--fructose-6-phosphate aminotransferase (isomerizing)
LKPSHLEQEIPRQAEAIVSTAAACREQIAALHLDSWPGVRHLVLTGCGDSLFAARLAETIAAADGIRGVVAVEALEFSRYHMQTLDEASVVVVLSYSGETVRAQEAAIAARSRGARVIAVTRARRGALAALADHVVSYPDLTERSNTRTASFQAAVVALCELVDVLSGTRRTVREPRPWTTVARWVESACRTAVSDLARVDGPWAPGRIDELLYLGAGPGLAAAAYGAAKAYEAATIRARAVELEEFCHCEIFSVSPGTPVVVIAPDGRCVDRAAEVLAALAEIGTATVCVSNVDELGKRASVQLALPVGMPEAYVPMVAAPFLQVLALRWALSRGDNPDLVRNKAVNSPLIRAGTAWSAADYRSLLEGERR